MALVLVAAFSVTVSARKADRAEWACAGRNAPREAKWEKAKCEDRRRGPAARIADQAVWAGRAAWVLAVAPLVSILALPKGVDYYLLRFFDYTVEPGKKYKYRVQLVMADPNYDMLASTLSPAVLDRQAKAAKANNGQKSNFRVSETWSDPSPTVGIPLHRGSVRLADVKVPPADKFNDEPAIECRSNRSTSTRRAMPFKPPLTRKTIIADMSRTWSRRISNILVRDTSTFNPKFKFLTGMTVLDVAGGTKMGKDTVPGRILLMGPSGEMYIRNEIDDKPFVEYHHLLFEKSNDRRRGTGRRSWRSTRRPRPDPAVDSGSQHAKREVICVAGGRRSSNAFRPNGPAVNRQVA